MKECPSELFENCNSGVGHPFLTSVKLIAIASRRKRLQSVVLNGYASLKQQ